MVIIGIIIIIIIIIAIVIVIVIIIIIIVIIRSLVRLKLGAITRVIPLCVSLGRA